MLKGPDLIGGEESVGIGLSRHLPERDGLFPQPHLPHLLATTGNGLTALIGERWKEFGEFHYQRRDLHVRSDASQQLIGALKEKPPKTFARRSIDDIRTLDGLKLMLENDGWILFRRSGTEPVLRIYCEAPTETAVAEILEAGLKLVEQFAPSGVS